MTGLVAGLVMTMVSLSLLTAPPAGAQPTARTYRVGYLSVPSRETGLDVVNAFEDGLRDLGWGLGKNVSIDYRFADGHADRVPSLAAELARHRSLISSSLPPR